MSYTTGTLNSYTELVNTMRALGQAAGWITHRSDDGGWICSNPSNTAHYSIKVTTFPSFAGDPLPGKTTTPCVMVTSIGSYNANFDYYGQPEQDINSQFAFGYTSIARFGNNGPWVKYHAFVTDQYIHMVVEIATATYGYVMVGQIDKDGAVYDGGAYNCVTLLQNPPVNATTQLAGNGLTGQTTLYPFASPITNAPYAVNRMRVHNVDNSGSASAGYFSYSNVNSKLQDEGKLLGPWAQAALVDFSTNESRYTDHPQAGLICASANIIGNNTMLIPAAIYYVGAQGRLRYMGIVRDHAVCDMSFLSPGDIISYGGDEWMIFPVYRKGTITYDSSLNAGVAFKLRR